MTRLGTKNQPAIARVQTTDRAQQILELCTQHSIVCIVGIEPDKPEDITDVERALHPHTPLRAPAKWVVTNRAPVAAASRPRSAVPNSQPDYP